MPVSGSNYAEAMSRCIDACQQCHHSCLEEAQRLLETVPGASASEVFAALVNCIGIARLTAEMLLTDSGSHQEACELCAKACRTCAELCKAELAMAGCMKACLKCAHCCDAAGDKVAA